MSLPQSGCYPWFINASPTLETLTATINFVANQTEYTSFNVSSSGISFNDTSVYTSSWTSEENRIVIFSTLPTGELLSWLTENGQEFKLSGEAWWLNSDPTTTTSSISSLVYEVPYDNNINRYNAFRAYSSHLRYRKGLLSYDDVDYPINGYNKFIVLLEPATDDLLTFLQTNATKIATGTTRQFTVSFDANGHGENPESQTVYYGDTLSSFPTAPTATGLRVIGWYKDEDCTDKWNPYIDEVVANITLYAKWSTTTTLNGTSWYLNSVLNFGTIPFISPSFPIWFASANFKTPLHTFDVSEQEEYCLIMSTHDNDTNEYAWVYEDDSSGETYQEGYMSSTGWIDDNSRSIEFIDIEEGSENFYIVGDLIDFLETNSPSAYTVSFNMNGHGTAPPSQSVSVGGYATRPTNPTTSGYIFSGWYNEQSCETIFNFNTPITSNKTLYAKWGINMTKVVDPQYTDKNTVTNYRNRFQTDISGAQSDVNTLAPSLPLKASVINTPTNIVGTSAQNAGLQGMHKTNVIDVLDADKALWFNEASGSEGWVYNLIHTARTTYSASTTYRKNDIVLYNNDGKTYIAKQNVPTGTLPTNTTYWLGLSLEGQQGNPWWGVAYKGDWDSTSAYSQFNMVRYMDGRVAKFYVAMDAITAGTPITDTNWLLAITMQESRIEQAPVESGFVGTYMSDDGSGNITLYDANGVINDPLYVYTLMSNVVIPSSTVSYMSSGMLMNNALASMSNLNNLY